MIISGINAVNANLKGFSVVSKSSESLDIRYVLPAYNIENYSTEGQTFQKIKMDNADYLCEAGLPELPIMSTMVAIPDRGNAFVELLSSQSKIVNNVTPFPAQINDGNEHSFAFDADYYNGSKSTWQNPVSCSDPQIMRDFRVLNIQIQPFIWEVKSRKITVYEEVVIRIHFSTEKGINELDSQKCISPAFDKVYKSLILNYDDYRNGIIANTPPRIVMVYGENSDPIFMNLLNDFALWKRQKGADVQLLSTAETGSSNTAIKTYLQNLYDDPAMRPDYVILIGDVSGSFAIPAWNSSGIGDYPYQMLSGTDLLGDVFLGRISAENVSQLSVIFAKIYAYEKTIDVDNAEWLNRMLLTADTLYSGVSVVNVSNYIREISLLENPEYTYTTLYQDAPNPSLMNTAINQGVGFFNYRGYAGMSGWSVSENNLYNTNKLCHAVIITCNTGNYDATGITELFIRVGTSAAPKGAVTAIGMWSAGTATMPNNALCGGIYAGIFSEGMRTMGEALLHSKLNFSRLYSISNPSMCTSFNQWCNLMGDPTMEVYTGIPKSFICNAPSSIPAGTNSMELSVSNAEGSPIPDACVTVTSIIGPNRVIVSRAYSDSNGFVYLPFSNEITTGNIIITVSKHDFKPLQSNILVDSGTILAGLPIINDDNEGVSQGNGNGIANSGETLEVNFTLRNTSTVQVNGITGFVTCDEPFVSISDSLVSFENIAAGSNVASSTSVVMHIAPNTPNNSLLRFALHLNDNALQEYQVIDHISVTDAELSFLGSQVLDNSDGVLDPGETVNLEITIRNTGSILVNDLIGELYTGNDLLVIVDSLGTFGNVGIGQQVSNTTDDFIVQGRNILLPGMIIPLRLKLTNSAGFLQWLDFSITVGQVLLTDPLGPDAHGYVIYDDGDVGYPDYPVYEWIGIAPLEGGAGASLNINDPEAPGEGDDIGSSSLDTVFLPFDFTFYGKSYRQITVSSNGFIVMGVTDNPEFRNYRLPGPMGPAPMIAAFWDDLATGPESGVYTFFDVSNHTFIIEWYHMLNGYQNDFTETFQIILYDPLFYPTTMGDGPIKIQYHTFNNVDSGASNQNHGNFCTIGIENEEQLDGLEYTFMNTYPTAASPLGNGRAIYITNMPVYHDSPWLTATETIINDGNNSAAEPGETIELGVVLQNLGNQTATGISAFISSLDLYVTIENNQSNYHPISGHSQGVNINPYIVHISPNCPDGHRVLFSLQITSSATSWTRSVYIDVSKPVMTYHSFYINDFNGNNNGYADPGESLLLIVNITNNSNIRVIDALGQLSSTSSFIEITNPSITHPVLEPGSITQFAFNITVDTSTPPNSTLPLTIRLEALNADVLTHQLSLGIGNMGMSNDFEANNGGFTAQNGWQWGVSDIVEAHSGSQVWATSLSGQYSNGANYILTSQPISVGSDSELSFWHQLYCQNNFDGGNVSISLNNGASWIVINPTSGGSYINSVYSMNEPGFSGLVVNWTKVTFNLAQFANQNIRIRWHFTSDGSVTGYGWMIDDVQVSGYAISTGIISGDVQLSDPEDSSTVMISTPLSNLLLATYPDSTGTYNLYPPYGSYSLTAYKQYYVGDVSPIFVITPDVMDYVHDFSLTKLRPVIGFALSYNDETDIVTLDWSAPSNQDYPLLNYKVYRKTGPGNFEEIVQTSDNSYSESISLIGHYYYLVRSVYSVGEGEPSDTLDLSITLPSANNDPAPEWTNNLYQNYPNPFNPNTRIALDLIKAGTIQLKIYNLRGQAVKTLANGQMSAGKHSFSWDGLDDNHRPVASGVYFYRVESSGFSQTRKMLLVK